MVPSDISFSSSILDHGIESARGFLGKIVSPALDELGLLAKDQVSLWRFKNQVNILVKARDYCEKYGIQTKKMSFKILCPLLDFASLEEEPDLQDKWANLLGNMADTNQNLENHVFPYILSQISLLEYSSILKAYNEAEEQNNEIAKQMKNLEDANADEYEYLQKCIYELAREIHSIEASDAYGENEKSDMITKLDGQRRQFLNASWELQRKDLELGYQLDAPGIFDPESVEKIELYNLIRLGLIIENKDFYAAPQSIELPDPDSIFNNNSVELDVDLHSNTNYFLTDLAIQFICSCEAKKATAKMDI